MKTIEREGKSTSSVISGFMKEFNLQLEDFKFEVIDEGKKGFLGLFASKPTLIRFSMQDEKDTVEDLLSGLLKHMGVEYNGLKITNNGNQYHIELKEVKDAGFIIGKEARILDAVQHVLNQIVNKAEKKQMKIEIDVDGYRERKKQQLLEKLKNVTERIKKNGRSFTFEPMQANRRKLIHQFVEKDKTLHTMTIGRGESKRVVISLAGQKNQQRNNKRPVRNNRNNRPRRQENRENREKTE